jgi:DNA polymerase
VPAVSRLSAERRKFDSSDTYSDAEIENFKCQFRRTHSATVRFWHALERAAHYTVRTKQGARLGNRLYFDMERATLRMTLPSGRRLAYPEPRMVPGKFEDTCNIRHKGKGWVDTDTWYGTLIENAVQAVARDLLVAAMQRLEAAGYKVVLHVHDEIVCEVPEDFGSEEEFLRLMLELP